MTSKSYLENDMENYKRMVTTASTDVTLMKFQLTKMEESHGETKGLCEALKTGHDKLAEKIDSLKDGLIEKDDERNERREIREREVDAKFAKVDYKLIIVGVISAVSPFAAGGVLYPQEAIQLVSAIYHYFV